MLGEKLAVSDNEQVPFFLRTIPAGKLNTLLAKNVCPRKAGVT